MSQSLWKTRLNEHIQVILIPALEDNYIFVIADATRAEALVVDPATAEDVQTTLDSHQLRLVAILNTHHHWDHVGGNAKLKLRWPNLKIYGAAHDSERIPGLTHKLKDGDQLSELGLKISVIDVRGHTRGHLAFSIAESHDLFVGDTLFGCGSGKLFEGSPAEMLKSLERLRALPDSTRVWCAHEYTEKNARIALQIGEANHPELSNYFQEVLEKRSRGEPTVPLSLAAEKKANPFLRWDALGLKEALSAATDLDTFAAVRSFRDQF